MKPFDRWAWPILVAAVAFGCFWPALDNGFVDWLTDEELLENSNYRGLSASHLAWMWTDTHEHYVPLRWMSLGLDYVIWGMNPRGYHLTGMLIHTATAVLFYFLLGALLRRTRGATDGVIRWAAAIGALLFAVHPLRVESVAWTMGRRDVLSGFFLMLTLLAYLRMTSGAPYRKWFILSLVCYALALLSKAWVMSLAVALLILDFYPLRRFPGTPLRKLLLEKAAYLAMAIPIAVLAAVIVQPAMASLELHGIVSRVTQAFYGLAFYPVKTLVPVGLSPLYPLYGPPDPAEWKFLISILAGVGVTAALILARRRWPAGLAAWGWYVVILAPVLGLAAAGLHITADRYSYLSCLSWAALIAAGLTWVRPRWRVGATIVAAAVLIGLGALTVRQTRVWNNNVSLWTQAIRVDPANITAYEKRAYAYAAEGRRAEVIRDFEKALDLRKLQLPILWNHYGEWRFDIGDYKNAILCFDNAIVIKEDYAVAYHNRGVAYLRLGDPARAEVEFTQAIRYDSGYAKPHLNRGEIRFGRGDVDGALEDFSRAIELNAGDLRALRLRGALRFVNNDWAGAVADYERIILFGPPDADAHIKRGLARLMMKDSDAGSDFEAARAIDPDPALPHFIRAEAWYMQRKWDDSERALDEALRLSTPGSGLRNQIEQALERLKEPR